MTSLIESLKDFPYLGETLALTSAFIWAAAVILFRISGRKVNPLGLNFFKGIVSILFFVGMILMINQPVLFKAPWQSYILLALSGIIGIGISETLFFASLNRLGASLSAVVSCTYSPFVIVLSVAFIQEHMTLLQLFGVLLITSAVLTISQKKHESHIPRKELISGIAMGTASMLTLAVGIVIMKPILNKSPLLWTTLVRLLGGVLFLSILIYLNPRRREILAAAFSPKNWGPMVPGSFLGGCIALLVWMGGMKYAQASQASALSELNIIFIFIFGAVFLKERVTKGRIIALFLAVVGAILVTI